MNIAEVFANPVVLAAEIQKFKDHNWTSAEWELFCASLEPLQTMLVEQRAEAYENGETAGFDDGESEGHDRAKKDFEEDLQKEKEKAYDDGYADAENKFNTPTSPKGNL